MKNICDLFLENKYNCKGIYTIGANRADDLIAYLFTLNNCKMDDNAMLEQYHYLYRAKEVDAAFRDNARMILMCYMAMSEDPDAYFKQVESIYNEFPRSGFFNYPVDAAIMIQNCKPDAAKQVIERTLTMYDRLKREHRINTAGYNMPKVCLLALTDRTIDDLLADFEACYSYMKGIFGGSVVYDRAFNRVPGEVPAVEKCKKVEEILDKLEGKKSAKKGCVEALDLFAKRSESVDTIAELIAEVDAYLKPNKDFHGLLVNAGDRGTAAALLVHKYLLDQALPGGEFGIDERIERSQAVLIAHNTTFATASLNSPGND